MIVPWILLCAALVVAEPLSADQAVRAALERSTELAAADAAVTRAEGALRAARGLRHDPDIGASVAVVGEAWSLEASQPLSLSGEGLADHAAARHALEGAEARRRRVELEVAADSRRSWIVAVVARQQALLASQALEVARRIEVAARERAAVGEASQLDLRIACLQVEQARTAWMAATVAEGRSAGDLGARVGIELPGLELPEDPLAGAPVPGEGSGGERSDLAAAERELDAARAALARERAGTFPTLALGAFVEQEGAELRAGPQVSLSLPLWRANVDGRSDALADLAVAEAERAEVERRVRAERGAYEAVGVALEAAVAEQDADVPDQAQAALDSVALGYDRGELDLLSAALLQAEILDGLAAWLQGRRLVAEVRLDRLLAEEDPRLIGDGAR